MSNKKNVIDKNMGNPIDLLYMTPSEVNVKDISNLLSEGNGLTIEIWDELNVLELTLSNQNIIDFEPLDIHFQDPSDAAFVKNRNIKTIFAISAIEEDLEIIKPIFEQIINQLSGFLCADTEDFSPVYVGSSAK